MYTQHGGSGLGLQFSEVANMPWRLAIRFVELLNEAKESEAKALKGNK